MSCDGKQEAGSLDGRVAVVTGASSGIGQAIAVALSRRVRIFVPLEGIP